MKYVGLQNLNSRNRTSFLRRKNKKKEVDPSRTKADKLEAEQSTKTGKKLQIIKKNRKRKRRINHKTKVENISKEGKERNID